MTIAVLHKFFRVGDAAAELEREHDLIIADDAEAAAAMTSGPDALRLLEQARTLRARHRPRLWLSLHSMEPVVVSAPSRLSLEIDQHTDQTYFELSYPGYARVELKLPMPHPAGWTFPTCTVPPSPEPSPEPSIGPFIYTGIELSPMQTLRPRHTTWYANYFAVGRAPSGPGTIVIAGKITPAVAISNGVTAMIRLDVDG